MYETQRMKWYWSGGMLAALILLIALLALFGQAPPVSSELTNAQLSRLFLPADPSQPLESPESGG